MIIFPVSDLRREHRDYVCRCDHTNYPASEYALYERDRWRRRIECVIGAVYIECRNGKRGAENAI